MRCTRADIQSPEAAEVFVRQRFLREMDAATVHDMAIITIAPVTDSVSDVELADLVDSLDNLWAADARRHDPLVSSDWPQREGET